MRAKKSLGQNFLTSEQIAQEIVDAAEVDGTDIVLEVGPGKGMLTQFLLADAGKVIAVEKDARLIEPLRMRFAKEISAGRLDLVEKDILEFDLGVLSFYNESYTVVANIPYYITGQLLRTFLAANKKPGKMILMVQKEVAERIVARDDKPHSAHGHSRAKESLLSLSVKVFGKPRIVRTVPKSFFKPTPSVDSAIIAIENIGNTFFENLGDKAQQRFFRLLHVAFSSKRKQLIGNLVNGGFGNKTKLEELFKTLGILPTIRAEDVSLGQWRSLLEKLT